MLPTIYKVTEIQNGVLTVMAKPVSGEWIEDEFIGFKKLGIDKIVSLLEKAEELEVGLADEESLCLKHDIEFESFPIADRGLPETDNAKNLINMRHLEICAGKHIAIHCRAGIGRTGIIAGGIMVKSGMVAEQAFKLISVARGVQVPDTEEQEKWLCYL